MWLIIKCRIPWAQNPQLENEHYCKFLLKLKSVDPREGFADNAPQSLSTCTDHTGWMAVVDLCCSRDGLKPSSPLWKQPLRAPFQGYSCLAPAECWKWDLSKHWNSSFSVRGLDFETPMALKWIWDAAAACRMPLCLLVTVKAGRDRGWQFLPPSEKCLNQWIDVTGK